MPHFELVLPLPNARIAFTYSHVSVGAICAETSDCVTYSDEQWDDLISSLWPKHSAANDDDDLYSVLITSAANNVNKSKLHWMSLNRSIRPAVWVTWNIFISACHSSKWNECRRRETKIFLNLSRFGSPFLHWWWNLLCDVRQAN